jgi:Family of unknown function (DUF5709)
MRCQARAVSDGIYEPENDGERDEIIDQDSVFGDDDGDEALDSSYSPPERPRELDAFGTTVAEQRQGESFEQRLAQEEPDPAMDVDLVEGEPAVRAGEGGDVPDDIDTGSGEVPDDAFSDGVIDDGEVGDVRAGRLVDPDEGLGEDTDKDMVGSDVGIDGGAASAEEAAMHIIGERADVDEGSSL